MSSVVISGDTSGAITLAAPAVSGTNTATLPAATGTVMVSGNMPAFSAYVTGNQSIANATFVKAQLNTKEFDTNNNFDSTTNYRFTPTVAGYYQINGNISFSGTALTVILLSIYKNGSEYKRGNQISVTTASTLAGGVNAVVYCNGSTDYLELYGFSGATSGNTFGGGSSISYFTGSLIRAA
jgi:hypothetical protein